jgi:hypothetical protein
MTDAGAGAAMTDAGVGAAIGFDPAAATARKPHQCPHQERRSDD